MAPEHSPLYKSIAEQLSAYIDKAVTEPMEHWRPPWTGRHHELPMEVLYDYDMLFPLPTGLEDIIGVAEASEEQKSTLQGVLCDMLGGRLGVRNPPYFIQELRLAYRSNAHNSPWTWDIRNPTPFVSNYVVLARAEGVLKSHRQNPRAPINRELDVSSPFSYLPSSNPPRTVPEKRLPDYIGSKVHARLVDVKSRLDAVGLGHLLGLVQPS
ncbi:hypothetical protein BDP27DRAFT_1425361 [Rhodocollybia butyracea]|uniref:Uncharacterized protein n=1 Tax=Rhodocollybia butyracea TaxID=206335 RepID=A0A9P5U2P0_9AGAR|nr:hypothetical protein BDP27DRAFT_1425361 [Rhodocollybia butyracea]